MYTFNGLTALSSAARDRITRYQYAALRWSDAANGYAALRPETWRSSLLLARGPAMALAILLTGQEFQHQSVELFGALELREVPTRIENVKPSVGYSFLSHVGVRHGNNAVLLAPNDQSRRGDSGKVV